MKKNTTSAPGPKTKAQLIKAELEKRQITKGAPEAGKPAEGTAKTPKAKKAKTNIKPTQEQLPLKGVNVKLDATGKAANRFRRALEQLELAQDEKGAASENLIKTMKKAKRLRITVEGYSFQIIHEGPRDKVKVDKPK